MGLLLIIIGILIGLAFLTLLERKVLGYIQLRKGPNKVGFMGLLQPFSDAIKLFTKGVTELITGNMMIYYMSPVMAFFFSLIVWSVLPLNKMVEYYWGVMFIMLIMSVGVYPIMISGWASNSNYAMLGGLRAIAQMISYEVSLVLIMMFILMMVKSMTLYSLSSFQLFLWFMVVNIPLAFSMYSSMLAETNRTPYDLAEGESELVSGFNIEYSGGGFALIFLAEYSSIIFMSLLFVMMFMGGYSMNIITFLMVLFVSFMFLWSRGTLPRFRYDKLMYLTWKSYLPMSLNYLFLAMGVAMIIKMI
uniref:NADH-ubiquinone oxidoreductase chain 1 n=1 Tax=Euborellia annulipes TaxID=146833 RepID=A0A343YVG6_9NEOP|nr:NADH dehydrogenase subunit 1 [Euborellia annulipes]